MKNRSAQKELREGCSRQYNSHRRDPKRGMALAHPQAQRIIKRSLGLRHSREDEGQWDKIKLERQEGARLYWPS